MRTQTVEDYLKVAYELQQEHAQVTTNALAERLGVTPASVSNMVKKLAEMALVIYEPYRGIVLTEAGAKIALEVIRHHRLVELYLAEALGVPWDRVHREAEKWEHVLSEDVEERMDALLGHPTSDPHGSPIPTHEGSIERRVCVRLSQLKPTQSARVAEVSDHDPALLRYLGDLGLYPNVELTVLAIAPYRGPLTLLIEGEQHHVGREAARHVLVTRVGDETPDSTPQSRSKESEA